MNIGKYLTKDDTKMLICSMVLSHLDYGNAKLVHLLKLTLKPLQSIQNYAAEVTCKKQKYDSSTDCLSKLHWLLIHYKSIYKLMTTVYKTLNKSEPQYLADKLGMKQWIRQLDTTYQTLNNYKYHSTEKRHKETEDLASQDMVTGINYQIILRKQKTLANSGNS